MIFGGKKFLVWCDDPPEDPVISILAGCLANHDRAHSLVKDLSRRDCMSVEPVTQDVDMISTFTPFGQMEVDRY
jgi:hypothetical protein